MSSSDWADSLPGVLDRAWELIHRGANDAKHPARTPVLATIGPDGPEQRILILRQADRAAGTVTLFTDAATAKVRELTADPRASLHIWDRKSQIQLRLKVAVTMTPGDRRIWDRMPEGAREVYGVEPPPGTVINGPEGFVREPNADKFLELTLTIHALELVALGLPIHRRALFARADDWHGNWLAP